MDKSQLTRRDFLKIADLTFPEMVLAACGTNPTILPDPTIKLLDPSKTPTTIQPTVEYTAPDKPIEPPDTLREAGERIGFQIGNTLYMVGLFASCQSGKNTPQATKTTPTQGMPEATRTSTQPANPRKFHLPYH